MIYTEAKSYGRASTLLAAADDDPFIRARDLPTFGIFYSPVHLRRLWETGRFPPPTRLSPRKLAWRRSAIRAWLASKEGEAA